MSKLKEVETYLVAIKGHHLHPEDIAAGIEAIYRPSFSKTAKTGSLSDGEFSGATYIPERDEKRLRTQLQRVFDWWEIRPNEWHTDFEVAEKLGIPQASAQARRRDLKKDEFGAYDFRSKAVNGTHYHMYRAAA